MSRGSADSPAAHVLVDDLPVHLPAGGVPPVLELQPEDAHHLHAVLRLRPGQAVGATDGRGTFVPCAYAGPGRLEPTGPLVRFPPRRLLLTVGFAPVKGDRPEWAVQKLTELGVDRIVLLSAERGVVRWTGDRAVSHRARLEKVARSALSQSRQVWLPSIEGPEPVQAVVAGATGAGPAGPAGAAGAALAQMGAPPPGPGLHTVLVGPEGGWSPEELACAPALVGLSPSVLRAETAAVAAGVILTALRAGVVGEAGGAAPGGRAAPAG